MHGRPFELGQLPENDGCRRDLGDGFFEYMTPDEEQYRNALRNGLTVVDTNVLLNLYRYHPIAREDLFRILEALGDRLFVPHQVAAEFWANREAAIRSAAEQSTRLKDELDTQRSKSVQSLLAWSGRVALSGKVRDKLSAVLSSAYSEVATTVDDVASRSLTLDALNTSLDPILRRLSA